MYLLRHGQSYFNLLIAQTRIDPGIADPELTPLGLEQAASAAAHLSEAALTHIIVSPYTRALQTAEPVRTRFSLPVTVMPVVRERAAFSCDIGSHPARLSERFPQHDFDHLPGQWWHEGVETEESTAARAEEFRRLMAAREDHGSILLVSHWAFILALTGESLANGQILEFDPTC